MTITNGFLNGLAGAIAGESFSAPTHMLVATGNNTTIPNNATTLDGEIGTRISVSKLRTDNIIEMSAVRTTADVVATDTGDALTGVGLDIAGSGSNLQIGVQIDELHTVNFDLEMIFNLRVRR